MASNNAVEITVVGNLTADPELRFTQSGVPVANFTVATTPRKFDRDKNEWVDEDTIFHNCSVWRGYAENVAESLTKGTAVIVQGQLKARSFEDRDGNKRTVHEIAVDHVGPALQYATAKVTRIRRDSGGNDVRPANGASSGGSDTGSAPAEQPRQARPAAADDF